MLKQPSPSACGPSSARELLRIARDVRSALPPNRYRHVLGVARTAERLACRYGASTRNARIAALLHDVARMWTPIDLLEYARVHELGVSQLEVRAPVLLHARVGAHLARERYGVDDREILQAIERHTVAVPGMSTLDKILFIADSIEPSRSFAERGELEVAAWRSLDDGMIACLKSSLEYLNGHGIPPAPETQRLYADLLNHREART